MPKLNVAVLWYTLTGYMNAALRSLAAQPGVAVFVADHTGEGKQAPFADEMFAWMTNRYRFPKDPDEAELLRRLEDFQPHVILVASWGTPVYRKACERFKGRAIRVVGMDNQWEGTLRQRLGVAISPFHIRPLFEAALVSGERQAEFARKLGFKDEHIWRGLYCGDTEAFAFPGERTLGSGPHAFLYAGRMVADKGIDTLLEAYRLYRAEAETAGREPWILRLVGGGNMETATGPGVEHYGFVQPPDLPEVFQAADCFVLPSRWENWGVVVHEAAASSLPIICTTACGASVHLVSDGYNGLLIPRDHPQTLAEAMTTISGLAPARYAEMALASQRMAQQLTPSRWAEYFLQKSAGELKHLKHNAMSI